MSEILAMIAMLALQIGVPPRLAQELAVRESGLNPKCVGRTGDVGLFQLNPQYMDYFIATFWNSHDTFDAMNPEHSALVGIRYLKHLHDTYNFNWWQTVVAYTGGCKPVLDNTPSDAAIQAANWVIEQSTTSYEVFKPARKE